MKKIGVIPFSLLGFCAVLLGCQKEPEPAQVLPVVRQKVDARRAFQATLKLTPEQTQKIREIRRQHERDLTRITNKFSALTSPYQAAVMASTRENKPLDPKVKKAIDQISKQKIAELTPFVVKFKEEEQAVYTPEQRKLLVEFAGESETI